MSWDPDHYLRFAGHRTRPGIELLCRVPGVRPKRIADLGCGTGHLTALLAERWPDADIVGVDSSAEMIDRAQGDHPRMKWLVEDIATWTPDGLIDVIYSNATLHWLDDHERLFRRLRSFLAPGGVLAVQMPDNWDAPSHQVPADILDDGTWSDAAGNALLRNRLASPEDYAAWLEPAEIDLWRTTYYQRLTGTDPVWEWVTGSVMLPILATLGPDDCTRFTRVCKAEYRKAYPIGRDGATTLPFSRLFIVATAPAEERIRTRSANSTVSSALIGTLPS